MTFFVQTNPALLAAEEDYNGSLVSVNVEAIEYLERPADLKAMGASLSGILADDPEFFVPYFIVMNTMNYQFWDKEPEQELSRYCKDGKIGALAMQESFQKAWESAFQRTDGPCLSRSLATAQILLQEILWNGVEFVFGNIPAADTRLEILKEVLATTGTLATLTKEILNSCYNDKKLSWTHARALAACYPKGYGDRYLKKAQLTLMFIAGQWQEKLNSPIELDVSAAADYQLPKVLRAEGVLVYGPELAQAVDTELLIEEDSPQERAIRAATIKACERLSKRFNCTIAEVDFWIWLMRNSAKTAKFHLTKTTKY